MLMALPMAKTEFIVRKRVANYWTQSNPSQSEPRHEKTCIRGLPPVKTQTGLLS